VTVRGIGSYGRRRSRGWWPLSVYLLATFLVVVGASVPILDVPSIQHSLRTGLGQAAFAVAAYPMGFAILLIAGGRIGERGGRQPVLVAGLGLLVLGTAGCALAPGAPFLIGARLVQGLAAALVYPQLLSVIEAASAGEGQARAHRWFGGVTCAGLAAGPPLGGLLTTTAPVGLSWRAPFVLLLVLGLAALAGAAWRLASSRTAPPERRPRLSTILADLDPGGLALLALAVLLVCVPLLAAQDAGWPVWLLLPAIASPLVLAALGRIEQRVAARGGTPLLKLRLVYRRSVLVGCAMALLLACGLTGFLLITALAMEAGLGLDPSLVALVWLPAGAALVAASLAASALTRRLRRHVLTAALLLLGAGLLATLAVLHASGARLAPAWLLAPLAVAGAGQGLAMTALLDIVLAGVRPRDAAAAAALVASSFQIGQVLGIAVVGLVAALVLQLPSAGVSAADRYLAASEAGLPLLALLASVGMALVLALPDVEPAEPLPDHRSGRLGGLADSIYLLTGGQAGAGRLEARAAADQELLGEASPEPGQFLVHYFQRELADVGWYRSLAEEARTSDWGPLDHDATREAVMLHQIDEIRRRQESGLVPEDLDAAALQLMIVALAATPHLLPQVTQMTTSYAPDTPEFRGIWGRFLRQLGERLTEEDSGPRL
jgi:MFS family permease